MTISIGVFDHMDSGDFAPHELYENRLKLIEAYDAAGFYGYHVAEHHQTSLGMAPSPGVFLAAAAARTTRIKLGPLIYIVPAYSPLRLIEEICMLDHLSKGRYQFGMGRGISPFETAYHGIRAEESHAMYREAVDIVLKGLTQESLSHAGKYWSYKDVPMVLRPFQSPHPPLWYGPSNAEGAKTAGERGLNIVLNNPRHLARAIVGSVETVVREINDAMTVSGCNYLVGRFAFGNMSYRDTRRSVDLFIGEVMPKIL